MNIIITGAGKGIGFETAKHASESPNNKVLVICRNILEINKLKRENVKSVEFDLSNIDSYSDLSSIISDYFHSGIDVLINNAGQFLTKSFAETKQGDFEKMLNINLKSPYFLTQALLPFFNKNAHILNISSMGGYQGSLKFPGLSAYSISKGALCTLTEALSAELSELNIKVNALCLGSVSTQMFQEAFPNFEASANAQDMGAYISNFAQTGHLFYNGKILPVSLTIP
ncbi:MAG: SDR family NAD(P)-dependent oxidoreductase [Bacteroidales bacterium]|nr:SDR family NAD(P)-dependent oxidoreductase [Bacteroidales bacterium]